VRRQYDGDVSVRPFRRQWLLGRDYLDGAHTRDLRIADIMAPGAADSIV
jgi:hypothetical protein